MQDDQNCYNIFVNSPKAVADLIEEALDIERITADMAAAPRITRRALALADETGKAPDMAVARVAVARCRFRLGQDDPQTNPFESSAEPVTLLQDLSGNCNPPLENSRYPTKQEI